MKQNNKLVYTTSVPNEYRIIKWFHYSYLSRLITQTILNSVPMLIIIDIEYMKDNMVPLLVFARLITQTVLSNVPNDMILTHSHSSQMGFEQI